MTEPTGTANKWETCTSGLHGIDEGAPFYDVGITGMRCCESCYQLWLKFRNRKRTDDLLVTSKAKRTKKTKAA